MSDAAGNAGSTDAYVLGHSDGEIERLKAQARLIDPITKRIFQEAGIVPGMRVLDVGSGPGDVAFLVADMVGETGEVVGVDRVPAAIDAARARASTRSLRNIDFQTGDPAEMTFSRPFDAVIGRYVLQFQKRPAV
jgi:ubiquinone/menaquinone biosynthesis C-methylase UbiE